MKTLKKKLKKDPFFSIIEMITLLEDQENLNFLYDLQWKIMIMISRALLFINRHYNLFLLTFIMVKHAKGGK